MKAAAFGVLDARGPPLRAHAESAIVLNSLDATVSVIDRAAYAERERIAVGKEPHHLLGTLDGKELWLTARWAREVAVVDLVTHKGIRTIPVGRLPHGFWFPARARWASRDRF